MFEGEGEGGVFTLSCESHRIPLSIFFIRYVFYPLLHLVSLGLIVLIILIGCVSNECFRYAVLHTASFTPCLLLCHVSDFL